MFVQVNITFRSVLVARSDALIIWHLQWLGSCSATKNYYFQKAGTNTTAGSKETSPEPDKE